MRNKSSKWLDYIDLGSDSISLKFLKNMETVYQDENNVVLDEKSVEWKLCINRESKSLELTINLYSCHDINMKFLLVVTPPSIYHFPLPPCHRRFTVWSQWCFLTITWIESLQLPISAEKLQLKISISPPTPKNMGKLKIDNKFLLSPFPWKYFQCFPKVFCTILWIESTELTIFIEK